MYYAITHLTLYKYSDPITDSVMEIRMQPRSDNNQSCVRFDLNISPDAKVISHTDHLGNHIHTFDIPAPHTKLAIKAESLAEVKTHVDLPDTLPMDVWDVIDEQRYEPEFFDMLMPGKFTRETPLLRQFGSEIDWGRRTDPLTLLMELNSYIYESFDYQSDVTKVDSPIDIALEARSGVCQDFSHVMITLVRNVGIPCRYVSGYLFHRDTEEYHDRSAEDATHAWVEAWLPELGWVGFDPTNNLVCMDRHIRVSLGNDYDKASPTRGVFKGQAETELEVQVKVARLDSLPQEAIALAPEIVMPRYEYHQVQQLTKEQQQQQQQ